MRLCLTSENRAVMGFLCPPCLFCKIFVRSTSIDAAINVGSFHPTLYVNKWRTKKLYKLYTKPYTATIKPYIESQRVKESKSQRVKETKRGRVEEREGGA